MKMEPGRPASPTGGPCPDPEPGGLDWPGIAPMSADPAPRPGLSQLDPADLSVKRVPAASYLPPSQASCPDPDPDPDQQLTELGPLFFWTSEPEDSEDYGPQSCQENTSIYAQNFSHSNHGRGEVDFFPSLPSPTVELTLEVGPGDAHQPSDLSQTRSLTSESTGCAEDGPRLRAVFDALDGDGDGFVRMEDFVQFATVYGAEQVKDLTKYLDPSGLGVISFEDFCRGITAIRNGDSDGQLCSIVPAQDEGPQACPDEFEDFVTFEANEVTDSAYMGSESTYSECETFTDEDTSTLVHPELQPEGDMDSAGGSAMPSECLDAMEEPGHGALLLFPGRSHLHSQSVVMVIGGEEHFEDYGEGSEAELSPETLCSEEPGCGDAAFLTPCPTKRLSSKKVARHLHQSGVLTMEALQDPPPDPVEGMEEDIADKVVFLEKRVSELEKDTAANGEQHSRLRQENLQLVHRANALEEQLKEQELRACEMVLEETRKQKELLCKMEREKSIEIENLQARLQQLDEENSELRSCTPCLKANIERLEEEKQKLLDEIEELSLRLSDEQENRRKLGDRLSHERHQFQKDKEATQELIEDLRKQLEHLQLFKLEAEQRRGRSSSVGLQEYNSRTRESELEQEVRRLKQDNRNLKEQNDELNGQIINLSIQGAKNLFSTSFSESLAAEISSVSRDELMEAIQKQEEINFRLQDYIDRIIVAIMETNPSILEVK
ncbi:rab11 family-interacting protein 3 isoform X2 [Sturnira hondurensis]|uniref:rab11 family-interacting protein 3 isoform X2 n=1 Tax=Sturnira hondurensis TaxID=192404 RepID=UPI00187911FA|nr:rab11 family-interacting protein 3 isoform X2 [Sturnira hondurensis]